jgi:hypothetical protein
MNLLFSAGILKETCCFCCADALLSGSATARQSNTAVAKRIFMIVDPFVNCSECEVITTAVRKTSVRVKMPADGNFADHSRGRYRLIPKEQLRQCYMARVELYSPMLFAILNLTVHSFAREGTWSAILTIASPISEPLPHGPSRGPRNCERRRGDTWGPACDRRDDPSALCRVARPARLLYRR